MGHGTWSPFGLVTLKEVLRFSGPKDLSCKMRGLDWSRKLLQFETSEILGIQPQSLAKRWRGRQRLSLRFVTECSSYLPASDHTQ